MDTPDFSKEHIKPLFESKFIRVFDLQYAEGKVEKIMLKQVGKVEYVILIKKQEDNMLDRSAGSSSC